MPAASTTLSSPQAQASPVFACHCQFHSSDDLFESPTIPTTDLQQIFDSGGMGISFVHCVLQLSFSTPFLHLQARDRPNFNDMLSAIGKLVESATNLQKTNLILDLRPTKADSPDLRDQKVMVKRRGSSDADDKGDSHRVGQQEQRGQKQTNCLACFCSTETMQTWQLTVLQP